MPSLFLALQGGSKMRELTINEVGSVSGGWSITIPIGGRMGLNISGEEILEAHSWAVGEATKFFTWWDPAGYYKETKGY